MLKTELEQIGTALGRVASGCFILTTTHDDRATGVLVSWVQQASFDPPALTVCLKHERPARELVDSSKRFLLNVLGEEASELFRHFGKGFASDEDAFAGLETEQTDFGPLLTGCIAHLACRVTDKIKVGDHVLYVGEVVAARAAGEAKPYMHTRRNGLGY